MKVTFLIGNGFDINCGLKCTFHEICEDYIKIEPATENLKHFKENMDSNIDTWADFEMAMNQYLSNFKTEEEALECIRDFKLFMKDHLKKEETLFLNRISYKTENLVTKACGKEIRESLLNFYRGVNNNTTARYNSINDITKTDYAFVTFNYTRVMDKLIKEVKYNSSIVHIHGTLDDETVLGIDNDSQLNTNLLFEPTISLRREFIKPVFTKEYDTSRISSVNALIDDSEVICVFGMSLGDTDLTWRNKIITWLQDNRNHHLFLYQYSCANLKYLTIPHRMDLEDAAKNAFFERIQLEESTREGIRSRIHIPIGKNIFNVKEVLTKSEIEQAQQDAKTNEQRERIRNMVMEGGQGA